MHKLESPGALQHMEKFIQISRAALLTVSLTIEIEVTSKLTIIILVHLVSDLVAYDFNKMLTIN